MLDPKKIEQVDAYFRKNEPRHASMLRTSVSPNIIQAGYRINVIPSEAIASARRPRAAGREHAGVSRDDPQGRGRSRPSKCDSRKRDTRPPGKEARIDSEAFKAIEASVADALQRADAADDEHRRDGHGVSAGERHAVLRRRSGHGHRGRPEGLRRAQRPGADPRKRADEVPALLLGRRDDAGSNWNAASSHASSP